MTAKKGLQDNEQQIPLPQALFLNRQARITQRLTLAAACFGFFMVTLDTTIVNVALPSIQRALGANISGLQWVVDGYTLVFASLLLMAGSLSDRFGSKRVFLVGLLGFTLTSALCSVAPSLPVLIIARLLQGIGAALLVPASLAIITYAYPDAKARAGAIGVWAAISAIAAAAGPVVGGILVESMGWRIVFFINVPVGIIGMLVTVYFAEASHASPSQSFDLIGQLTGIIALASLAFVLIEGGTLGWTAPLILLAFVVFVAATSTFLFAERSSSSPMLPLALFRSSVFSATTVVGLLLNFSYYGLLFLLSLFFQQIQGYSALQTGLRLLPLTIINVVGTSLSGRLTGRTGPRTPMAVGLAVCALGVFVFLITGDSASYILVALCFLAIGFGASFAVPALTTALLGTVAREQSGIASGVLNASRQTGGVFGVAVLGSLLGNTSGPAALHGIHIALGIAGAVLVLGCAITIFSMRSQMSGDKEEQQA